MNLREQVLKGGAYMIARQGLGMGISFGGVIALTRLIGPANYGLYAGALGIVMFLGVIGRFGIDVFLVRREEAPDAAHYDQAFTILLLSGIAIAAIASISLPFWTQWFSDPRFSTSLRTLLPVLPLSLVLFPAMARLERDLNYQSVALLELSGQSSYYVVALTLGALGYGVWAPVAGFWTMQGLQVAASYRLTRFRPHFCWSPPLLREMLRYGLGYSGSSWVWQLRSLVNPLVVGRYLGAEAVGYVTLAIKLVEVMSVVKRVTWRLSVAVLAKVQGDHGRLRRGIEEGMVLQVLAVAPLMAGFATVSSWLFPSLFGERWDSVLEVYPFIALSYLINAVFNLHSSVLYVLKRNWGVARFNLTHIILFASASFFLVPRFDLWGYGLAEIVALLSYAVINNQVTRVFTISYARVLPWLVALIPPLFAGFFPFPDNLVLWLPTLAVALWPRQRRQIAEYVRLVRWRTA